MTLIFLFIALVIFEKVFIRLYEKSWNKGLGIKVGFLEGAVDEGKKGHIIEEIYNKSALPIPVVSVKFELDKSISYMDKSNVTVSDRQYRNDSMSVKAKRAYKREFEVLFSKRGVYKIEDPALSTKDIFGVHSYSEKYEQESLIYVYPSYSRHKEIIAPYSKVMGEAIKNKYFYEDPFEFKGIRDYTGTEPMKKINWGASARTGSLKVNNYYDTTSRHAVIFLDIVNDQIWKRDDQLEECIRITRNYMETFIRNHIPVEIITNGIDGILNEPVVFEGGSDGAYVEKCLKKMAAIDINKKTERLTSYFTLNKAKNDELSILLSVDQSKAMIDAYREYLGCNEGEWICPISSKDGRNIQAGNIHVTYPEVGR